MNPDGSDARNLGPVVSSELTVTTNAIYALVGGNKAANIVRIRPDEGMTVVRGIPNVYRPPTGRMALVGGTLFGLVDILDSEHLFKTYVFRVEIDGSGFRLLDSLNDQVAVNLSGSSLVAAGGYIYGVAQAIPGVNGGALLRLSIDGMRPTVLYEFPAEPGDVKLDRELMIEGNAVTGSTFSGGVTGQGSIFRLDLTPRLVVTRSNSGAVLTWPPYATDYVLEATSSLFPRDWATVQLPTQQSFLEVTNLSISTFYRLRRE